MATVHSTRTCLPKLACSVLVVGLFTAGVFITGAYPHNHLVNKLSEVEGSNQTQATTRARDRPTSKWNRFLHILECYKSQQPSATSIAGASTGQNWTERPKEQRSRGTNLQITKGNPNHPGFGSSDRHLRTKQAWAGIRGPRIRHRKQMLEMLTSSTPGANPGSAPLWRPE